MNDRGSMENQQAAGRRPSTAKGVRGKIKAKSKMPGSKGRCTRVSTTYRALDRPQGRSIIVDSDVESGDSSGWSLCGSRGSR